MAPGEFLSSGYEGSVIVFYEDGWVLCGQSAARSQRSVAVFVGLKYGLTSGQYHLRHYNRASDPYFLSRFPGWGGTTAS